MVRVLSPVLLISLGAQGACLRAKLNSSDCLADWVRAENELKRVVHSFFLLEKLCL